MSICHLPMKCSVWIFGITNRTNSFSNFQSDLEVFMYLFNLLSKSCKLFWKYSYTINIINIRELTYYKWSLICNVTDWCSLILNQPVFEENKFCNFKIHFFSILNIKQTNNGIFFNKARDNFNLAKIFLNVRVWNSQL